MRDKQQRDESGFTLIELVVAMAVLSVVLASAISLLVSVLRDTRRIEQRADSVDQVRAALRDIDRQIRSGNVLYDPLQEVLPPLNQPPHSMRIYTQANGVPRCVQWRVTGSSLQTRGWSPNWTTDGDVSGWRTVARGIANLTGTVVPPFTLNANPGYNGPAGSYERRLLDVTLLSRAGSDAGKTVRVNTSLSGRNTVYGYDAGTCAPPAP